MNVPTMTIGASEPNKDVMLEKLNKENAELRAMCEDLRNQLKEARSVNELTYLRGRCDGLEFSIRCNGVSGTEVRPA